MSKHKSIQIPLYIIDESKELVAKGIQKKVKACDLTLYEGETMRDVYVKSSLYKAALEDISPNNMEEFRFTNRNKILNYVISIKDDVCYLGDIKVDFFSIHVI